MPRYIEELNECTDPEPGDFLWVSDADATATDRDRKLNLDKFELRKTRYYPLGAPTPLNLASTDADLKGFVGGFTDGRYGYFVPYSNGAYFGKVARVDLNNFAAGGITVLNLASTDADLADLKGFNGGFTDGRYGYFVPYYNGAVFGKVARVLMMSGGNL